MFKKRRKRHKKRSSLIWEESPTTERRKKQKKTRGLSKVQEDEIISRLLAKKSIFVYVESL